MQTIVNYLQIISEALSSGIEYLKQTWADMAQMSEWLVIAVDVGRGLVAWCPEFLRNVMGTVLSAFIALRFVGRD